MPALQVKDFPSDLYEELRECAVAQDRSISQQTVRIVREYLIAYRQADCAVAPATDSPVRPIPMQRGAEALKPEISEDRFDRRKKVFEAIDALPQFEVPLDFSEPAELVRNMREERDARLVLESGETR